MRVGIDIHVPIENAALKSDRMDAASWNNDPSANSYAAS